MKALVQRVQHASVSVDHSVIGKIGHGLLVYIGFRKGDTANLDTLAEKILHLRIFPNDQEKMDLSLQDVKGEILIISQFTLYGDCRKGRRPSFEEALEPGLANSYYEQFIEQCEKLLGKERVFRGRFGASMKVESCNLGPTNFLIEL